MAYSCLLYTSQSIVEKGTYNPDKAWAGENGVFDLGRALQNFGAGAILGGGFGAVRTPVRPQICLLYTSRCV